MHEETQENLMNWVKADTFIKRLCGLLGKKSLGVDEGMYFPNCRAVHTYFMQIPIMVLFCDKQGRIIKVIPYLKPWSWAFCADADFIVELQANHPFSQTDLQWLIQQNCMTSPTFC